MPELTDFEQLCSPEIQQQARSIRALLLTLNFNDAADFQHVLSCLAVEAEDRMAELDNDPDFSDLEVAR